MIIYPTSTAPQEKDRVYAMKQRLLSYYHITTKAFASDIVWMSIINQKEESS
jgi:hypothetical protein